MCDHKKDASVVFNRLGGRNLEICFPNAFIENLPPYEVRMAHCLRCGEPMNYQEMYPPGKTPRYMHDRCFEAIAYSGPKYTCLTCGMPLPQYQINAQVSNPRELTHALHPGVCKDYHSALAGIVFGIPFRTNTVPLLPERSSNVRFDELMTYRRLKDPDVIEVEPVNPFRKVKLLKFLE